MKNIKEYGTQAQSYKDKNSQTNAFNKSSRRKMPNQNNGKL
jgi:hypothetical protein